MVLGCLHAYLILRLGGPVSPWEVLRPLRAAEPAISDVRIIDGELLRRRGQTEGGVRAFRSALRLGPPLYSDGLSYLVSGLRDAWPLEGEPGGDDDLRTRYLATVRLTQDADLHRVFVTATASDTRLRDLLNETIGPSIVPPEQLRETMPLSEMGRYVVGRYSEPWQPSGSVGRFVIEGSRLVGSVARAARGLISRREQAKASEGSEEPPFAAGA